MMSHQANSDAQRIARELSLPLKGVAAALGLLSDGNTIPFVARYRKEATGGLDEVQLRATQERRQYLADLAARRNTIAAAIDGQGKLSDELRARLDGCATKAELEDLYLPYKKKRRTRAAMARERGLEPLAKRILAQPRDGDPKQDARAYVNAAKDVPDVEAALAGARDIVAEHVADRADIRQLVRETFTRYGEFTSSAVKSKTKGRTKFEQYYDHREPLRRMPSHRFLAVLRGEAEGILRAKIDVDVDRLLGQVERKLRFDARSRYSVELADAITDAYKRLIAPSIETEVRADHKRSADVAAIEVFADNLRNLLLAAPFGARPVIGIDPGQRTGCKCAAIGATGEFLATATLHLVKGAAAFARADTDLSALIRRFKPSAIAVGNGTGGRECETFVRNLLKANHIDDIVVVQVSEAGASVYSASDVARAEFPDLDLTIRGAISIARRLQDPLSELVKVDAKAIGVGQYQHDVDQKLLAAKLDDVVETCVNHVGVELNTASAPLLSHVAGIGPKLAERIVTFREGAGRFQGRKQLLKVPGFGPKAFEQAAGFLRIRGAAQPLDDSAVHPERYALVQRMARDAGAEVAALIGDEQRVRAIDVSRYISGDVGEPTLVDIVNELLRPGRDPRDEFEAPQFRDDIRELSDLAPGMQLEGVVTNVTAFGAFVDLGVHQDGLVHISQLADRYVKDPNTVVRVGQRLKVRVLEVDLERKRIALSAKGLN